MRRGIGDPRCLKVIRYTACLIDMNDYLAMLPEAKEGDKICEMELNVIMLKSMPNIWIK